MRDTIYDSCFILFSVLKPRFHLFWFLYWFENCRWYFLWLPSLQYLPIQRDAQSYNIQLGIMYNTYICIYTHFKMRFYTSLAMLLVGTLRIRVHVAFLFHLISLGSISLLSLSFDILYIPLFFISLFYYFVLYSLSYLIEYLVP
jgi:hypothetical protein